MFNDKMIQFAAGFGLSFFIIHIVYIFHIVAPEKISNFYMTLWRIFFCFLGFSIVYIVHTVIIIFFKQSRSLMKSSIPLLINLTVFILICTASLFRG
jgi:hypothetical protein